MHRVLTCPSFFRGGVDEICDPVCEGEVVVVKEEMVKEEMVKEEMVKEEMVKEEMVKEEMVEG
jgi:putative component of membrane protein insertase Oxa1/YidC/SpoIIIJ protein YidD